jgi:hypothetical protein
MQGVKKADDAVVAGSKPKSSQIGGSAGFVAFASSVYPLLNSKCASCHQSDQAPLIADDDASAAYNAARTMVDWKIPLNSKLLLKIDDGHCGPYCSGPYTAVMNNYFSTWMQAEGVPVPVPSPSTSPSPSPKPSP